MEMGQERTSVLKVARILNVHGHTVSEKGGTSNGPRTSDKAQRSCQPFGCVAFDRVSLVLGGKTQGHQDHRGNCQNPGERGAREDGRSLLKKNFPRLVNVWAQDRALGHGEETEGKRLAGLVTHG
jgi:hypothetical protein